MTTKHLFYPFTILLLLCFLAACSNQVTHKSHYARRVPSAYNSIEAYQPKQYSNAYNYFYGRAVHGDRVAQNNLGRMYMDGRGIKADPAKAVYWYQQAATKGYRAAQVNLGVAYLYGRGVKKNKHKACHWFAQAKLKGSKTASNFYRRKC